MFKEDKVKENIDEQENRDKANIDEQENFDFKIQDEIENKEKKDTKEKKEKKEALLLKGKPVADKISDDIKQQIDKLTKKPKLAIIRVGNREDDLSYERGILNRCSKVGIETEVVELSENISQKEYIEHIHRFNEDEYTNSILCFRPLPRQLNEDEIKYEISPKKDVDCFNPQNLNKVFMGEKDMILPCTPQAVIEILKYYNIEIKSKNITVLGRSTVVGKPVAMLLLNENATVTIAHSKTENLAEVCSNADILVVAIGKAKMIDDSFVKDGAIVID
jgi:methylenetetrahydrofolate dehydrogenase (NADP+)/methenyltetrahydrofolate cyclohydrolase